MKQVTPASGRHAIPESRPPSNIVDFPRRPIDFLHAAQATNDPDMLEAYSWHPIDDEKAFADAALEMVGEWLFLAAGAVCALIVVACFLYGKGVL